MERYNLYKDSGVEWIGEIPNHWGIKKFKHFIEEIGDGGTPSRSEEDNFGGNINWIVVSDIKEKITSTKETLTEKGFNSSSTKLWDIGDVIISLGGTIGKVGILEVPSTTKQGICGIKPNLTTTNRYVFYLLQLNSQLFNDWSVGSTIFEFRPTRLRELHFQIPPFLEQQQIVSFLDTKTSLIDSLIEKTKRKIELLKEKRTSIINEVVTKGLNPNVMMKKSGVECIGKIPSDWDIPSLNKISNITRLAGYEYTSYWEEDVNGEIEVLRGQNIGFGEIIEKNIDRISNELSMRLIRSRLFKGDLVFPCVGTIGNCVVINEDDRYHINQNISKITPFDRVNSNFLCYYLLSHSTKFQIMFFNTSEVQPSVLVGNLRRFKICLPPIIEQQQIVEYLDEQTQRIDKTISIEEKRVKLLKEYRQSLISEVVTGKRKVV